MPKRYRCQISMRHTEELARAIQKESQYAAIGDQIIEALYEDQHDLYHDTEFFDGCSLCDICERGKDA